RHLFLLFIPVLLIAAAPPQDYEAARRKAVAEMGAPLNRYVYPDGELEGPLADPSHQPELAPLATLRPGKFTTTREFFHEDSGVVRLVMRVDFLDDKKRTPLYRFAALYRIPKAIPADRRFGDDHAALARAAGLKVEVVERNADLVKRVLRGRPFGEWSRD